MKKTKYLASGLLSALLIPISLYSVAADISDCRAIADRLARYACYDSWDTAAGAVSRNRSTSSTSVSSPNNSSSNSQQEEAGDDVSLFGRIFDRDEAEPEEPAQTADEPSLFGRIFNRDSDDAQPEAQTQTSSEPESETESFGRAETSSTRVQIGENGRNELIDTIASLELRGPGLWRITLEGGQQWRQMYTKNYMMRVGDEVRIYPSRWGTSYRLSVERLAGYIQVERAD